MWFVYKETSFHRKTLVPQPTAGYPGIATQQPGMMGQPAPMTHMGQMDPMGQQMQMQPQTQYDQQQYATGQPGY